MITAKQAMGNPELMIKYKDRFKNIEIFLHPWYHVFMKYPYLYREFSDRYNDMYEWTIAFALGQDPTLVSDLKDYLHKIDKKSVDWLLENCPELSLCMKHRDNPDKIETAHYILFPHKLNNLNNEEKREMGKKVIEFLKEEKA